MAMLLTRVLPQIEVMEFEALGHTSSHASAGGNAAIYQFLSRN
jgi:hypothetical protein